MIPRPEWHLDAACRDHPEPDLWHSDATGVPGQRIDARAKAICRTCPVQLTCLAENFNQPHGVWGGMTADERRRLRRESGPTRVEIAHGSQRGYVRCQKLDAGPCEACRDAHNAYNRSRTRAKRRVSA